MMRVQNARNRFYLLVIASTTTAAAIVAIIPVVITARSAPASCSTSRFNGYSVNNQQKNAAVNRDVLCKCV